MVVVPPTVYSATENGISMRIFGALSSIAANLLRQISAKMCTKKLKNFVFKSFVLAKRKPPFLSFKMREKA